MRCYFMSVDKSIFELVNYGKIILDVKTTMDKKKISITKVVKMTGLHHKVVNRYYNSEVVRYDSEVLAKLCYVLECDLSDIIHYKK